MKPELEFITKMLKDACYEPGCFHTLETLQVQDVDDGGMGSLVFDSANTNRQLGQEIAKTEFFDGDGVKVFASLRVDNYGDLYELDLWKVDFTRLLKFPQY